LNFDSFLPLFGDKALKIPVAAITDADPVSDEEEDEDQEEDEDAPEPEPLYPAPGDVIKVSANTAKMKKRADGFVQVFHGLKTFEYDLALDSENRDAMLKALADIHPRIAKSLRVTVDAAPDDAAKARALFSGMFERRQNNVQKGRYAQALAQVLADKTVKCNTPDYIVEAIKHACQVDTVKP
jgi:putative ATP-dependent endonuclease of the OLD family